VKERNVKNVIRKDMALIDLIADRAVTLSRKLGDPWDKSDARMDLIAAHSMCPLRLAELLVADDFNFAHDVFGINRHLNHQTFRLDNHFRPRFAAQ
jgi:hypothetical protein